MPEKTLPINARFGKLKILGPAPSVIRPNGRHSTMSLCLCDCGRRKAVRNYSIRNGGATSCGVCWKSLKIKHGKCKTATYQTWASMKQRCYNPKAAHFEHYGSKGVVVCKRWKESFEAFWQDMGDRPLGKSLDRYPDPNGNYCPTNCRWASRSEQARNTVRSDFRTVKGVTLCLKDLCRHFGVSYGSVYTRVVYSGWSVEKAISQAPKFHWA